MKRLYFLLFLILAVGLVLIFRLFTLQILNYDFYKGLATNQHQTHQILPPKRGEIFLKDQFYDQNSGSQLFSLAVNKEWSMVYAVPREIEDREAAVKLLAPLLEIDEEILRQKINKRSDPYEPLKSKVSSEIVKQIEDLNIKGIKLIPETWRYFPANTLACHVVGFVGFSGDEKIGQYGIEGYYNNKLGGEEGYLEGEQDTRGSLISVAKSFFQPAEDGTNLILTIDPNIQFFIEEKLKEIAERLKAEGGTIIIENPKTGAIRALANWPTFNPNNYSEVKDINVFLNPVVSSLFEPGSIFKPITMAIALDRKLVGPNTTYEDKGFVKIGGYTIENSVKTPQGIQTMTQVLEKSLNTGAVFVGQLINKKTFKDYLERFGFSQKTGIDLEGEIKGNISNLKNNRDIEYATATFGQGIAVTPIELISALSAIANGGKMMKPHVVEKIIYSNGKEETIKPMVLEQVVSPETAETLTKMMVSVVENGWSKKAYIPGYFIAGKTGTAQVPDPERGGYSDKTIHSFGGFFPAFDPQFFILIKLDNPKGIPFASESIVPVFREIAEYIINYYEIPPSR